MPKKTVIRSLADLPAIDRKSADLNAVIETPKGSRAKFEYDEELCLFKLGGMLPEGSMFPFNFGFIPSTRGEDGDPLDLLVLMEEPVFTGCLVPARLIGVIAAMAVGAFLGDWMLSHAHTFAPVVPLVVIAAVIAIASVAVKRKQPA